MSKVYSVLVPEASIQIGNDSPVPVYRQIVDQVRLHLNAGALSQGDSLPSVRSLATQLGVHFNTVAEAYRELAQEGWIDLRHGRRATVLAPGSCRHLPNAEVDSLRQRLRHLLAEMRLKGISVPTIQRDVGSILLR